MGIWKFYYLSNSSAFAFMFDMTDMRNYLNSVPERVNSHTASTWMELLKRKTLESGREYSWKLAMDELKCLPQFGDNEPKRERETTAID